MHIEISKRLMTVAEEIAFDTFADIGCDHGYLPIYACQTGRAKKVIACDSCAGPLKQAEKNVQRYGLCHSIELRRGLGLQPLNPGEVEAITISGLGGRLISDILSESPVFLQSAKQLVLQPQRDTPALRRCIHKLGFMIENEILVYKDMIYYNILNCRPKGQKTEELYTPKEYLLGKILIDRSDSVLSAYISQRRRKLLQIKKRINPLNEKNQNRITEIDEELELLQI